MPVWFVAPLVILVGAMALVALTRRVERCGPLLPIVVGSFALRVALMLTCFAVSYWRLPMFQSLQAKPGFWTFSLDSQTYHYYGEQIATSWALGIELLDPAGCFEHCALVAGIYRLFGVSPLYPLAVDCWLMALAALLAYVLGRRLFSARAGLVGAALVGFWPSSLLWTAQLLKDPVTWFLCLAVLVLVPSIWSSSTSTRPRWEAIRPWLLLATLALALAVLTLLRTYLGVIYAVIVTTMLGGVAIAAWRRGERRTGWRHVAVIATIVMAVITARSTPLFQLLSPPHPELGRIKLALQHWSANELPEAAAQFRLAIRYVPSCKEAYAGLGTLKLQEGNRYAAANNQIWARASYGEALSAFSQYLQREINPRRQMLARTVMARTSFEMAVNAFNRGWLNEAREAYHQGVAFDPSVEPSYKYLPKLIAEAEDDADAMRPTAMGNSTPPVSSVARPVESPVEANDKHAELRIVSANATRTTVTAGSTSSVSSVARREVLLTIARQLFRQEVVIDALPRTPPPVSKLQVLSESLNQLDDKAALTAKDLTPQSMGVRRRGYLGSGGNSLMDPSTLLQTPSELVTYLPRALAIGFLAPFPRQWVSGKGVTGTLHLVAAVDMVLLYLLLPAMLIGSWLLIRRRRIDGWLVLAFIAVTGSAMSLVVANLGILFRLRLHFLFPLFIVTGGGIIWLWEHCLPTRGILSEGLRPESHERPLRIVRILARLNMGGPAIHVATLSTTLPAQRYRSLLVTGIPDRDEGDMSYLFDGQRCRRVVVPALQRSLHPWRDLAAWWQLWRIIRRERPDIVETHTAKAGALGRTVVIAHRLVLRVETALTGRSFNRCRTIHTFHGHVLDGYFSPLASHVFLWIERWLARHTDRLVAVSATVRDALLAKGIGRSGQWHVITLGLDLSKLTRLSPPNGTSPLRIGLIGRLVAIKNPHLFVEALYRVTTQQPLAMPIEGVVVGDGPLRPALEEQTQRLGLAETVRFTGWQRDLVVVYNDLTATCLTSWNEGMPMAVIEAMAAGRPVIATDVGGVRDLFESPGAPREPIARGNFRVTERGLLVNAGDADGLAAALARVATDAPLRARLGRAARQAVAAHFTKERLMQEMTTLYDDVVAGCAAGHQLV